MDNSSTKEKEGDDPGLQEHWYLVDTHGQKFRLPKTMLFLGREECDVVVASQSVDKRHAVLTFDLYLNRFKVKDLSTTNGTYVNNSRIPEQEYVTLNHMDSVRLGHDAMMYHVEQGSQITGQGGQLPDPSFVPAWASRHHHPGPLQAGQAHGEPMHVHAMAECQGCIAEQNIEHSCSLKQDPALNDDHVRVSSSPAHHHHHHPHYHSPHHRQSASPSSQHSSSSPSHRNSKSPLSSDSDHHQHHHYYQQQQQHHSVSPNSEGAHEEDDDRIGLHQHQQESQQDTGIPSRKQSEGGSSNPGQCESSPGHGTDSRHYGAATTNNHRNSNNATDSSPPTSTWGEDSSEGSVPHGPGNGPGRNTWPRKRARPVVPHVSDLFAQQLPEDDGTGSEARPVGGMYFVAFDDSVCNGASTGDVQRRPRNSQNPLPPELATVKKGTPLYGQPSWWGDDDEEASPGPAGDAPSSGRPKDAPPSGRPKDGDGSGGGGKPHQRRGSGGKRSRPNSLGLSGDEAESPAGTSKSTPATAQGEPAPGRMMNGERIKPTYMEIPFGDDDDDVSMSVDDSTASSSGKKTVSGGANASATSTPAKSVTSSLSRDSLLDSPDARQTTAPSKPSGETATSFTVDFSDPSDPQHRPTKAVTMAASLSQYVPSKIRRNFRDRQDRAGSHTKAGSSSRGSTPSKTSEERELSPAHQASSAQQHQRKLEEIWSVVEGGGKPPKQSTRLSSVQATAGSISSLRSPNLEDIDKLSGEDRLRGQKTSSLSPQVSRSARTKTSPSGGTGSSKGAAGVVAAVAQYPDSTSYLIDKMFEGGSGSSSVEGSAPASAVGSDTSEVAPEKQLYREAAGNDRTRRSTSSATSGKQAGKPVRTAAAGKASASGSNRRTSSSSTGKPVGPRLSSSLSSSKAAANTSGTSRFAPTKPAAAKAKLKSAPSPLKICDSDDENEIFEDDDLQITEDEEAPLSLSVTEDGEVSDKASEAGTYVIEAGADEEEGEEEEEEARRKIDEVFGVDKPHSHIDPLRLASPGGYDNVYDEAGVGNHDDDNDETFGADGEGDEAAEGEKTPLDDLSPLDDDGNGVEEPAMTATDGVQTWMSQLNALTNSHRQPALSADDRQMAREDGEASLSRKPPQAGGKRPGTGRKLPSIPTTDRSPVSSEHSSTCVLDPDTGDMLDGQVGWSAASSQRVLNGHRVNGAGGKVKSGDSAAVLSRNHKNGVAAKNCVSNGARQTSSSPGSARSRGSVDTELLLQDTETVMAAMEARMAYRTSGRQGSGDSDTDVSSTVALVNGDEEYVKPSYYTSPRDALSRTTASHHDVRRSGGVAARVANNNASLAKRNSAGKSYSQTMASKARTPTSSNASPRTPTSVSANAHRRSIGSDVYSGRDSVGADSLASDAGSESGTADGSFSRTSSRGKGTMSMTKPNRAFQLRRARSDSVEESAAITPRSAKSGSSVRTPGSSARSSSVHSTSRTRSMMDTNRSEATSLGAQIARKSRANGAVLQASDGRSGAGSSSQKASSSTNLHRQDGGRHSLRLTRASSLTISSPGQPAASSVVKASSSAAVSSSKSSHARNTPTGSRGNLAVTGVSTSTAVTGSTRSHSQPGSRSNSPKAAERIAWRRRKEYDPRRAVAEAKAAKAKESGGGTVTMRPKPHANSRANRRMIRSASFTNTGGSLALSLAGSVSASQELVSGPPTGTDYSGESGAFRRAFLPFQAVSGRLGGHHSAHSADEDDSSPGSIRASYDSLIVSSIYQLSMKLVSNTDKSLHKLRDQSRASHSPSPCDDFMNEGSSGRGEMTAFRSANQELAGVLSNLRRLERHVQVMNSVLFPEDEVPTRLSAGSLPSPSTPSTAGGASTTGSTTGGRQGKQRYFAEIERIRSELAGFHPIGGAQVADIASSEADSPEMAELSEQF